MAHLTHPDIILRLKRAEGHLRSTIAMIEQGRPCADLAQQLHAIEKSITAAKKTLIHDHIDHCLETQIDSSPEASRQALKEFKEITKYL
ncbi:metal-sensing transcriptional repressor [Thiomonas sp. 13-64-67]|jgi:DNA-binding FrmR family transcriptional regulator|uniref:metal-sensing transcriptional repressor n=1 Tax=Thiomonas sp. 13-64-67 TaxID=1970447 RepID=UPI000BD51566|nr:metal-sensing transcriptional repressor [Thiomonas sp. 13-64-67]OZB69345.1 MAG: metal resistance protein [Thiomonas sp. 13-64-67]